MELEQGKKPLGDRKGGYSYNEDDLPFSPLQVDFDLLDIVQKQGNTLGLRIGTAANYTQIEKDGTIEFNGDATVWDDLRVPVTSTKPGNTLPDFTAWLAAGGLKTWFFDGGGRAEEVHFTVQLPHSWKIGTDLVPHVHWTDTNIDTGNVRWSLEYTWADENGTFGASTTIHKVIAVSGVPWKHVRTDFAAIDGSGITGISSMLVCRLYRDSSHADDTFTGDAALLEIDFHYEIDTIGSRAILTK